MCVCVDSQPLCDSGELTVAGKFYIEKTNINGQMPDYCPGVGSDIDRCIMQSSQIRSGHALRFT